jgi:hypothetical protein
MFRLARVVCDVVDLTFNDVDVEQLDKPVLELPNRPWLS